VTQDFRYLGGAHPFFYFFPDEIRFQRWLSEVYLAAACAGFVCSQREE